MFTLSKIANGIYLIVENSAVRKPFALPDKTPFKTYGLVTADMYRVTVISKSPEVAKEQDKLVQLVMKDKK